MFPYYGKLLKRSSLIFINNFDDSSRPNGVSVYYPRQELQLAQNLEKTLSGFGVQVIRCEYSFAHSPA